jgi:cyclophilin family peptidyl-prolyl cis-trans isomerase
MNSGSAVRCCVAGGLVALLLAATLLAAQPGFPAKVKSQQKATGAKKSATASSKTAAAKTAGKSAVSRPDAKSLREWKTLDARRRKLHGRLKDLQTEFDVSSRVRKLEIKKEFERLVDEWKTAIAPKMVKLSLAKLADDPESELASRLAEDVPDQRRVAEVTDRLIKEGNDSGPVLRLAGLARFNLNEFQRAADLLKKARDKNARLTDPDVIDLARDYAKSWRKELELRKKEDDDKTPKKDRLPKVLIETSQGKIVVELFENEAPNTVANFISLVESKFYDGQRFYNSRPLRSIEAGDPKTKQDFKKNLRYGFGGPGYTIKSESTGENARMHFRGSLSMVNYGKDTEGSLFYILRAPMPEWNPSAGGLGGQTVFGRVFEGIDVVDKLDNGDKIVKMTVLRKRSHDYKPKTSADKDEPDKNDASKTGRPAKSQTGQKSKAPAFPKTAPKAKGDAKPKKTAKSGNTAKQ